MASDSESLIKILDEVEIYPDDPNYPFPSSVGGKAADKVAYWFKQFKENWSDYPTNDNNCFGPKKEWEDSNNSGSDSWSGHWRTAAKSRVNNFTKSDETKSGFKIFREITGFYRLQITDDATNNNRAKRLAQILKNLSNSEYGLIDPKTGKEAVIDLESTDGRIEYFFENLGSPSTVCYNLLEAEVAPLLMTDTLLESNLRGFIYENYATEGRIPNLKSIFPQVMQRGKSSQIFLRLRDDIPTLRADISNIISEMTNMENINEVVEGFVPETPEYGTSGELKSVTKSISLKDFLALPFDNAKVKTTIQDMRPPVDGMKRGKNWPNNDAKDWIIHITQDPVEVMMKSTNKRWRSCENLWGGRTQYSKGCWSDFRNGNAIALFYRASDLLDDDNNFTLRQDKVKGRTMLRWGMANVPSEGSKPRIGIETKIYQNGMSGDVQRQMSAGLISIMEGVGLWDWEGTMVTPYTYMGYADRHGGTNRILHYPKNSSAGVKEGGIEMDGGEMSAVPLDYNNQLDISYGEFQGIMEMNDSDEIYLNLAENPVCWNYHRVIGAFVRNLFAMYDEDNREVMLKLLLQHDYANPALLITALESMDAINPNFRNLANIDDVIFSFANHPRSNSEVHEEINTLFGDDAKLIYGLPNPPTLTPLGGPIWNSFSYPDDSFWQPYVDRLSEISIPESSSDIPENVIREQFSRFGEWYAPVLERWGGLYVGAPPIVAEYNSSGLGMGIWAANQLAYKLLHQPTISQTQFETLLDIYFKINLLLETDVGVVISYESQMLFGTLNLLTLNFNKPNYQGWELYGANANETPIYAKTKLYRPRTNETVNMALAFIYQQLMQNGLEFTPTFLVSVFNLYGGCKSSSEVEVFYNFITTIVTIGNQELVGKLGEDATMEIQAKLIPMLFLSAFKRTDMTKKGLRLLPQSAIPAIFALLTNNSFGEGYYNAIFYDFIPQNKYGEYIDHLATSNESKIVGERKPSSLSETMVFNLLMNEEILEWISIEDLASQIPANDDLFYVMEDVMLTYYLEDMYNPEGEKPFADLSVEQLNLNSGEHFEFNLLISNALPAIASMLLGFLKNKNTPDEIIERIIQKPRFNSVGYRRMFEYYGMGEDYFSTTVGGSFSEEFITPLTNNYNIKGRLLKYLYKNYPEQRENLILNPNLVEARLFDEVGEQYPIKLLANYGVTKRAYMRHMRNIINGLKLSPEYSFNPTYHSWIDVLRNSTYQFNIQAVAQTFVGNINNRSDLKFIRAGRMRFGTSLPTAPDGATDRNLSRAGSIPDYPQIPDDGQPFALFRGLNINLNTLSELSGLGREFINEGYERPRPTITQSLGAISSLLLTGQINSDNIISLPNDSEGNPVTPDGVRPSITSLFQNLRGDSSTSQNADMMMVFESEYVVNDEDIYAEIGNYSNAILKGVQFGNGGSMNMIANPGGLETMRATLNKETNRKVIMEFIEHCPDGLEIFKDANNRSCKAKLNNSIYEWDYDSMVAELISSEAFYNYIKTDFESRGEVSNLLSWNSELNPVYAWLDDFRAKRSNYNIGDRDSLEELWQSIHNSIGTQEMGNLFMSMIMRSLTTFGYIKTLSGDSAGNYKLSFQIVNGEYNLESLFGWIEPELRTVLTNYDSKGRFNDRLSAFLPDWLMVISMNGLGDFTSSRDDSEVVEVPAWRLNFSVGEFNTLLDTIKGAVLIGELKYTDYLDSISLLMESIGDSDCVLFPPNRGEETVLYGFESIRDNYGTNELIRKIMTIPDIDDIKSYEDKLEIFSCGLYLLCGQTSSENSSALIYNSYMNSLNSITELLTFASKFMWDSTEDDGKGDELINLLISLDNNEESGLSSDGETAITQEMKLAYSKEKLNNVRKFINTNFTTGLKTYQKYAQVMTETSNRAESGWPFSSPHNFNTNVNNSESYQMMIPLLFDAMVTGYIGYLNDNILKLNYRDFILMVRLLSFMPPEAYLGMTAEQLEASQPLVNHTLSSNRLQNPEYIFQITDGQRTQLENMRDRFLPLFIQALRTTTIREDEEFIE